MVDNTVNGRVFGAPGGPSFITSAVYPCDSQAGQRPCASTNPNKATS